MRSPCSSSLERSKELLLISTGGVGKEETENVERDEEGNKEEDDKEEAEKGK